MFYSQFLKLCEERNKKPTGVARALGLSPSTPKRWEKGSQPKLDVLQRIAEYFDISVDYFLQDDDKMVAYDNKNSTIIQGSSGKINVSNSWGGDTSVDNVPLSDQEIEIVRIFRKLDLRAKTAAMSFFFDLEDKAKG